MTATRFPEELTTERLVLRKPRAADAGDIFRNYAADPEVTRYLLWKTHRSIADTHEFLAHVADGWREGREYAWSIRPRDSAEVIGMISAGYTPPKSMIGYVLSRAWWGRGVMSEALSAVMGQVSGDPTIHRVWAYCHPSNVGSARVMEKAGMEYEGTLRSWERMGNGELADARVYARAGGSTVAPPSPLRPAR